MIPNHQQQNRIMIFVELDVLCIYEYAKNALRNVINDTYYDHQSSAAKKYQLSSNVITKIDTDH